MKASSPFLFDSIIFGPIKSRRLGNSLGINLLPTGSKLCNFNCIYCECGWTNLKEAPKVKFHPRKEVRRNLQGALIRLGTENSSPDFITFAGNGEPAMHPEFAGIIDDALLLRNRYFPDARVAVLTNALMLNKKSVAKALKKVDLPILKLDAGTEKTFQKINQPIAKKTLRQIVNYLLCFKGRLIVQTLFLRGEHNGIAIDNTTGKEVDMWLKLIKKIRPESVMIYSLDRATPSKKLEKIPKEELKEIARKVSSLGVHVQVS